MCKLTDIDGNIYNTVKIGNQVWMAENLRVTKYNDGSDIPLVTDSDEWAKLTTPAYCWHSNNATNKAKYGTLYNWYTVNPVNPKKISPEGWHIPINDEWIERPDELNVILSGYRDNEGSYYGLNNYGRWWSTTEYDKFKFYAYSLNSYNTNPYFFEMEDYKNCGFSVRLVKD